MAGLFDINLPWGGGSGAAEPQAVNMRATGPSNAPPGYRPGDGTAGQAPTPYSMGSTGSVTQNPGLYGRPEQFTMPGATPGQDARTEMTQAQNSVSNQLSQARGAASSQGNQAISPYGASNPTFYGR